MIICAKIKVISAPVAQQIERSRPKGKAAGAIPARGTKMSKPIFRKISFSLFFIGLGVGLLLATQWKVRPTRAVSLIDPYLSLKNTNEKLSQEQSALKNEIAELHKNNSQASRNLKENETETKGKVEILEQYKKEIGLVPLNGKGIIIIMDDSSLGDITENSIAHAADLRDTVNFLWGKGAKAISINGERVVASTSIDCIVNTILINKTKITNPFVIMAIGNQNEIFDSLKDSNSLSDIKSRVSEEGLKFEIKKEEVNIPVFNGSFLVKNAKSIN